MKKSLLYLFALICSMGFFTACSDDDEPNYTQVIEDEIAGKYKGTLDIALNGTTIATGNRQQITITSASATAIDFALTDFSFQGIEIGDVTLEDCPLTYNGSTYDFTGTTAIEVPDILTADVQATGTVGHNSVTIELNIDASLMGMDQDVTVTYQGTKLNGTEGTAADITAFIFDNTDAIIDQPVINGSNITFTAVKGADLTALVPTITVSEGATVTPASGVAQDFSEGKRVTYTVVSEDYGTTKTYTVSVAGTNSVLTYDFENWTVDASQTIPDNQYPIAEGWASCNQAVLMIKAFGAWGGITYTGAWPVTSTTDAHSGQYAASMESVDTQGGNMMGQTIPKVTAGTLFLGEFNAFAALTDPMTTTSFGVPFDQKPLQVRGYYKYTAGTEFYNAAGELQEGVQDECAISAVLYEVENEDETLDGSNIYNSDKIVATAQMTNGGQAEYAPFNLELEYVKEYDATKTYKFAIIFSASKDGASYNAAVGSKLIIDDVQVICE